MNKPPFYIASLILIVITALRTAVADPVAADLAERATPSWPAADPTFLSPTTATDTTTTTTTTLLTIPRCPDNIAGAEAGSQGGYNYWSFHVSQELCDPTNDTLKFYCFENPQVDVTRSDKVDWQATEPGRMFTSWWLQAEGYTDTWAAFVGKIVGAGASYADTCFICGCFRDIGCFPPGVKITMADGSLRKIEDVQAGDTVRNARTGAPVKVRQVIEGPEALPLIRFGFDDTTVTTSQAHPVLTGAGLKPANKLEKGDTVFDAQGNPHALTILETLPLEEGQRVINVDLDAASSVAAERLIVSDGIVTGDIVLQGLLKERK